MGLDYVRLYAVPESRSGSVDFLPDDKGHTKVFVGIGSPWGESLSTLLHEVYEKTFMDLGLRYRRNASYSEDSSEYLFSMTHNQLGEVHDRVGDFLKECLPDFRHVWDKTKKEHLRRKKLEKKKKK